MPVATRGMFDLAPVAPARVLPGVPADPRRKVSRALVSTYALPGMSTARRDTAPVAHAHIARCPQCGEAARLPIGDASAVCSRCLNGTGRPAKVWVCMPAIDRLTGRLS